MDVQVCQITLPAFSVVEMNASLGPIISSVTGEVVLEGEGATVTLDAASVTPVAPRSGLARLEGDGGLDNRFYVHNVSFTWFTDSVFNLEDISVSFEETKFYSNRAEHGKSCECANISDRSTFSLPLSLADPQTDERNGLLLIPYLSTLCMHVCIAGAALYLHRSTHSNITHCHFWNNHAESDGGVLYFRNEVNYFTIFGSTFYNNEGGGNGGGVLFVHEENYFLRVLKSNFTNNSALSGDGGAFFIKEYNDYCDIKECQFINNTATVGRGGAVMILEKCHHFSLTSSLFVGNSALQNSGGAVILLNTIHDIHIEACIFEYNYAALNGGAFLLFSGISDIVLHRNDFISNIAGSSGGAIYMFISIEDVTVTENTFLNNIANSGDAVTTNRGIDIAMGGGAVYIDVSNTRILFRQCRMHNNSAPYASGGSCFINSNNLDITFMECNQTFNFAYRSGGGIYMGSANTNMIVHSGVLANNSGHLIGGGGCMMLAHNSVFFINTIIRGNHATVGGGLLSFLNNFNIKVQGCVIQDNDATLRGGAMNIGILHDWITIENTQFSNNWAMVGGGISIETGNHVTIQSCQFSGNIALPSTSTVAASARDQAASTESFGGAVFSTSDNLHIKGSTFKGNAADSGGALYVSGDNMTILSSEFLYNAAILSGGAVELIRCNDVLLSACNITANSNVAVKIDSSTSISIIKTRVVNSRGANGAAVATVSSEAVTIAESWFENNTVSGWGGALYFSGSSGVRVETSVFVHNDATKAGAISVDLSSDVILYNNTFCDNHATIFGGGAVSLISSPESTIHLNRFENNSCVGGGGAVFWSYNGGRMLEPYFLFSNQFIGNLALYGNDLATDAVSLVFIGNSSSGEWSRDVSGHAEQLLVKGEATIVQMNVYDQDTLWPVLLVDKYDQVVANEDAALAASTTEYYQCGEEAPYLTGQTMAPIVNGQTSLLFTSSCNPQGYMRLAFWTDVAAVPDLEIELQFRQCLRGEYFSNGQCVQCSNGTYSLVDPATSDELVTSCSPCPVHATCYGDVILVDEGYWRLSGEVSAIFSCPLEDSCAGGLNTGVEECNNGYTGVLCAVCSTDYYFPSLTARCEPCSDASLQIGLIIVMIVVVLVVIGLFISVFGKRISEEFTRQTGMSFVTKKFKAKHQSFKTKKKIYLKSEDTARKYQNKLKQLVTLFQILSAFSSVLSTTFPTIYHRLTSWFNILNLGALLEDLGLVCSFKHFDYINTVVAVTVTPILMSGALYTIQRIHCYFVFYQYSSTFRVIANTAGRIEVLKSTYLYVFLFFTYLILPGVSTVLFGMLKPCTDVDPGAVEGGGHNYLEADLSIRCEGSRYHFGVTWAILGCFVYPIGIPCLYFYLLYNAKDLIQSRAKIDVKSLDQSGLDELETIGMKLSSFKFLFQEYEHKFWYFEIIETFRKLFLTSVLSVISPGSTKQLVVGNLFVVLCLIIYIILSPFDDLELTMTSAICQVQIWFILFLAILIKEEVHISSTFIEVSIAVAILFILIYETFWCIVEFCPLPKPVEAFFDQVVVSKSHPIGKSSSRQNKSTRKLDNDNKWQDHDENSDNINVEKAVKRVILLISKSLEETVEPDDGDDGGPRQYTIDSLDAQANNIDRNIVLLEKMKTALIDQQNHISRKLLTVEEEYSDVDGDEEVMRMEKSWVTSHRGHAHGMLLE